MKIKIITGVIVGGVLGGVIGHFGKCAGGVCPLVSNPLIAAVIWAAIGGLLASSLGAPRKSKPADETDAAREPERSANEEEDRQQEKS